MRMFFFIAMCTALFGAFGASIISAEEPATPGKGDDKKEAPAPAPAPAPAAQELRYKAVIDGMMCAKNCAPRARKAIEGIQKVKSAIVDFETKTATITMEAGATLEKAKVEEALKPAGFTVKSFEAVTDAGEKENGSKKACKRCCGGCGSQSGTPCSCKTAGAGAGAKCQCGPQCPCGDCKCQAVSCERCGQAAGSCNGGCRSNGKAKACGCCAGCGGKTCSCK